MVRLEPILSDPEEDRAHNHLAAALLGAVIGGGIGLWAGIFGWGFGFWATLGCVVAGGAILGLVGYWKGEAFTYFMGEWLKGSRWSIFRRDDW